VYTVTGNAKAVEGDLGAVSIGDAGDTLEHIEELGPAVRALIASECVHIVISARFHIVSRRLYMASRRGATYDGRLFWIP
jgi:hypothetical protein